MLEVVDTVITVVMLVAVSPVVLCALCWLRYGPPGSRSSTIAHNHPAYGEVFGS